MRPHRAHPPEASLLRLPGMAEQLGALLAKAAKENLAVLDMVDRLCDEEKASRLRNAIAAESATLASPS